MTKLLQDWVTEQAQRRPGASAVVSDGARLTYADLDARSNRLGRLLREAGCRRGDRVALLMPKSAMAIVALLGIYKADAVYVPLDPSSPAARLKKILDCCGSRWLLACGPVTSVLNDLFHEEQPHSCPSIGWLESAPPQGGNFRVAFTLGDVDACSAAQTTCRNSPEDPAHILFTSGSTGTPKGVVITHSNVIHLIEWAMKYFEMDPSDRVSAHPPLHFDMSFFDIFGAAAAGAAIHLVPPELNVLPGGLADFIRSSALTQWFSVPSVLNYLAKFDAVKPGDVPALKRLCWAGEVLPTPTLIYWMKRLPHVTFTNLYGPTETTIVSSYYTVAECPENPRAAIPIGTACGGEELLVLNDSLEPVSRGETGNLYIGGVGLAREYWQDPERTAAAFVRHPNRPSERVYNTGDLARVGADGFVYFLGRRDSQVKSRGYRVELGEIEAALNAIGSVRESAVVTLDAGGFEGAVICCAYVPAGADLTPLALRRQLGQLIPRYMLPSRWLSFDCLPRSGTGKIDRRTLGKIFEERFEPHAAQSA
jgi:amino acid adenylation domain-containing protein